MAETAQKDDPKLWEKVKKKITAGDKGGEEGEWSARKAQLATAEYKKQGGGYRGKKSSENSLSEWTKEEWGTKSGEKSKDTGERYLPKKAREALTDAEYKRTSAKKRADTRKGKQFSAQPEDVAEKAARAREGEPTKADLLNEARRRKIPGRSRMSKAELERALK